MSMNRRRSAGPPFTRIRSSGENMTTLRQPMSSPDLDTGAPSRKMRLRSPLTSSSRMERLPPRVTRFKRTMPSISPMRMSSASRLVRWLRPRAHKKMASSTFVFPAPLRPVNTVRPGSKACSRSL